MPHTGSKLTVDPNLTTATEPGAGELLIVQGLACGSEWAAGCAQVSSSGGLIFKGKVVISPATIGQHYQTEVIRHEFGYVAGLGHYNDQFNGTYQVMNAFTSGDL